MTVHRLPEGPRAEGEKFARLVAAGCLVAFVVMMAGVSLMPIAIVVWMFRAAGGH